LLATSRSTPRVPSILACRLLSIGDTSTADHCVCVAISLPVEIAFGAFILFPARKALNPDMDVILPRLFSCRRFDRSYPTFEGFAPNQDTPTYPNAREREHVPDTTMDDVLNMRLGTPDQKCSFRECEDFAHSSSALHRSTVHSYFYSRLAGSDKQRGLASVLRSRR
jgi:hypothetical protein